MIEAKKKLFILYLCLFITTSLEAGMGIIHKIQPAPSKKTWVTAIRQGTFLDEENPSLVFNTDAINGVITISAPGVYMPAEDLTSKIVIAESNVTLDLGSHAITRSTGTDIIVSIASGLSHVIITGGYIKNTDTVVSGGSGVFIGAGCSKISLTDLTIIGCTYGVNCSGTSGSAVFESVFSDLSLLSNTIGILFSYVNSCNVSECNALYSVRSGFELNNSAANAFDDCAALKTTGTDFVAGFRSIHGTDNVFQRCVAQQTKTSAIAFGTTACGFVLTGSEQKTGLIDCVTSETDVLSSPTAQTYGVNIAPIFNGSLVQLMTTDTAERCNKIAWSPDGRYFAVTSGRATPPYYGVAVCSWDGSTITCLSRIVVGTRYLEDIVWSPDGKYILVCDQQATVTWAYVLSFDGATLSLGPVANIFNAGIGKLAFSPNGKYIAVFGYGNTGSGNINNISINGFSPQNFTTGAWTYGFWGLNLTGSQYGYSISWSPDGQYIVAPYNNSIGVVKVTSESQMQVVATYSFPEGPSYVRWSPCGRYIAVGGNSGTVKILVFDGSTLGACAQMTGLNNLEVIAMDWSPDGNYIMISGSASANVKAACYAFTGTQLIQKWVTTFSGSTRVDAVAWSPDGRYVLVSILPAAYYMYSAMYGPTTCLVDNCIATDAKATSPVIGAGIYGARSNNFTRNIVSNNSANISYGISNAYFGKFDLLRSPAQPFDNVALP